MSEQQYNRSIQQLRESIDLASISANATQVSVADGDPVIVAAWQACIARLGGVIVTMRPIDDSVIEMVVTFHPYPNSKPPVIKSGTKVTNAVVEGGADFLKIGSADLGIANPRVITLRREKPDAAVFAAINTSEGGRSAYLPPKPKRAKPPRPVIEFDAVDYRLGHSQNVARTNAPGNPGWVYGVGVGNGGPPWNRDRYNRVVYMVNAERLGPYKLEIRYAAADSRPVQIQVKGPGGGVDQVYPGKLEVSVNK